MITDREEIRRLAALHRSEDLDFQRYLKAHHQPEGPFHILSHEIEQQVDCTACANCCRYTEVDVSADDIARLAAYLDLDAARVKACYTKRDPNDSAALLLGQSKDGCVFLNGNLCMVYEARPRACRDFPHLDTAGRSLGSRLPSIFKRAWFCPIVYNVLERYKTMAGFRTHGNGPEFSRS